MARGVMLGMMLHGVAADGCTWDGALGGVDQCAGAAGGGDGRGDTSRDHYVPHRLLSDLRSGDMQACLA